MPPTRLSPLDLAIVAAYLIGITIFGLRFSRRTQRAETASAGSLKSYFLAGNTIPWWAIALSIVSAETSTLTIISIPGVAFAGDLGFLQVVLGYMLGRVVVALLFLPRYFRGEMLTAYQLIDQRFGHALHKLTAGLFLLTRAAAEGVRVFAISIVVGIAIGTRDVLSIAIISVLTLAYTFEGGMAAVIWTDVVQMGLYIAGTIVALLTLGHAVPGGWAHIYAVAAPLGKFHWLDFSVSLTKSYTFWAGVLGGTFLTMASHGTDQLMVQRMLAARNLRGARVALLSSGVVIFVQFTLFLLIGVGLFVFYGGNSRAFGSADRIFPTFIVREMPHGVAGLLVAAILAAAMSNLSAALNSLASTTVVDFYLPWMQRPRARTLASGIALSTDVIVTDQARTRVSRAATVVWAGVLFAIAVYSVAAGGKGHVVETGLSIASVAYGCLLGVFLLGTLTRYATQTGAIVGMIFGLAVNLFLWLTPADSGLTWTNPRVTRYIAVPHVAFTWYVLIGAVATFAVGSLFSALRPGTRRSLAAVLTFCLVLMSFRSEAQESVSGSGRYDFSAVSSLINTAIAQKKLPGAVVVIGHQGRVVFEQAYGNRALEPLTGGTPEPMTTDTIFDMASLSKVLVTTTAILQLYEQHKIDLDAPVAKYLPEFAVNGKDKITVSELMTHYSGLPEDVDLKDPWGLAAPDKAEGIRRAMNAVPYGPPGRTFKYSDINFITLGDLVEKLSNEPLSTYAEREIFSALGLQDTAYHPLAEACGPKHVVGSAVEYVATVSKKEPLCSGWKPIVLIPLTAPTEYDDQGTAATNPDFVQMLRGTVHDPTTRRMGGVAGHAGVFSTAEDTARFAQALLDKLLHNTGPFPLSQATLQMATRPNEPATAVDTATIFTQTGQTTKGVASRGLGWDLNSPFSRPRGTIFPITIAGHPGSFGHTGFTGTSLWIDPTTNTYVILLSNAIHPRGAPPISALRGEVATAAAQAIDAHTLAVSSETRRELRGAYADQEGPSVPASHDVKTLSGIDVLEQTHFAVLTSLAASHAGHLRLGLVTNQTGLDARGHRTIDILAHAGSGLELTTLFTPEHGLYGKQDTENLSAEQDAVTHLPVISLYGPKPADKRPKLVDLKQLDAVVVDLQDAGVRFYTYETLLGYFLEACAHVHIPLIVLDRPNPIGGIAVQGPLSEPGRESYTDFTPLPVRHGMTLGELARFFNTNATEVQLKPELLDGQAIQFGANISSATGDPDRPPATQPGLHANLTVIPLRNWHRADYFDVTGLAFTPPSPNLRSVAAEVLYPGVALLETTNVSVGRGTATPFEQLGAPWLDAAALRAYLSARTIPGVVVAASTMTIAEDANHYPSHGMTIPAVRFTVTDRNVFDAPEFGLELLAALHHLYPRQFELDHALTLLANKSVLDQLRSGADPRDVARSYASDLDAFRIRRAAALLYQ